MRNRILISLWVIVGGSFILLGAVEGWLLVLTHSAIALFSMMLALYSVGHYMLPKQTNALPAPTKRRQTVVIEEHRHLHLHGTQTPVQGRQRAQAQRKRIAVSR